ncbi:MAG: DedA family protein, partial [Acidimicrobiales bacterium]
GVSGRRQQGAQREVTGRPGPARARCRGRAGPPTRKGAVEHFITTWGYLAIFVFTVCEAACIPVPSEITLGLGGALASGYLPSGAVDRHPLNLAFVILLGICGEMVGSYLAYVVGRTGGRAFVDRWGKYVLLSHKDLDRAEAWFARRGEGVVLFGRVVPLVRAFVSFVAGMAEMEPVRFGLYTVVGVTVWVGGLAGIGYGLGGKWHSMVKGFGDATYVIVGLIVVGLAVVVAHRWRALRAQRAIQAVGSD